MRKRFVQQPRGVLSWIPAPRLRGDKLRGNDTRSPKGVQRGEAPLRYLIFPQEWGTKGVDERSLRQRYVTVAADFALLYPPYNWEGQAQGPAPTEVRSAT